MSRSPIRSMVALGALLAWSAGALAQATPAGLWKTVDDETGEAKSYVRITDDAGMLSGRVDKLLDPSRAATKCDKCGGARKDQPVLGMTILEGVRKNPDEPYWDGGTILDPNNGKTYRVRLTPKDGGRALEVRGFIGPFYRNQQWQRVE
jgi:uncharacterized protein (DUF2147 family)